VLGLRTSALAASCTLMSDRWANVIVGLLLALSIIGAALFAWWQANLPGD
jgi:hypothetical protein